MRKKVVVGVVLGLLVVAGTAAAAVFHIHQRAGNLILDAEGGVEPTALPKYKNAPITGFGGGKLTTVSGNLPPILKGFTLEFDKHGAVDTTGLPFCTKAKLVATDVAAARRACGDAIVGEGFGHAVVKFPEQGLIKASSPITVFNGPKKGNLDTVFAHAYLGAPVGPVTFIVPIVIEKIHKGVYGYRINVEIPKIAGGYGHPISGSVKIGRKWMYKGKQHSYINARCETGHLQSRGEFTFKAATEPTPEEEAEAGEIMHATFSLPCSVRK